MQNNNNQKNLKLLEQALEMQQRLYGGQPYYNVAVSLNNLGCS